MSVVVSVEDIGSCQKRVTVAIPAPAVAAEADRVTREFRSQVNLPGFRKGKTPMEIVRKKFHEEIEKELLDRLLPRYWKQAESESGLEPLLAPQVEDVEVEAGEDLTFVATVDVRPEIELGELGEFDLPEAETEPSEDEVRDAIEELRRAMAEWKDADRPAARGDLIVAKLREAGSDDAEREASPTSFEVGDERVWEELTLAATGMAAGQRAEFERQMTEGTETITRRYELEVEKVRERELAPLDEKFASSVGEFDSVEALESGVRSRLRLSKVRERRVARETALLDQLCERYPVEVPKRVVDKDIEEMLSEYASSLAGQGVDLDRAEIDWQRMAEEARPRAEKRVRARLLMDRIGGELGIEVAQEEIEAAIANMARAQRTSSTALRRDLDRAGRLGDLREQLTRERTLVRLLGDDVESGDEVPGDSENAAGQEEE